MTTTPERQLELFARAVIALGGQRAVARLLDVNERHIRMVLAGDRLLHDGFLRDTSKALLEHAEACRQLERALSPDFSANLTDTQRERLGRPDTRRADQRRTPGAPSSEDA